MAVTFQFPDEVEQRLRAQTPNLDAELKEAAALELFRQGKVSHYELSQVLGLDKYETNTYLKRHNVYEGSLTMEDLEADRQTLDRLLRPVRDKCS